MIVAFARERSEWEKVADRADEGLRARMTNWWNTVLRLPQGELRD